MTNPNVQMLHDYIDAFNARDFERLVTFYCDEIDFDISNGTKLTAPQQIVDHYSAINTRSTRVMRVLDAFGSGDKLAAEFESEFEFVADDPTFPSGAASKGDRLRVHTFVHYRLVDGRFQHARSATLEREWQRA